METISVLIAENGDDEQPDGTLGVTRGSKKKGKLKVNELAVEKLRDSVNKLNRQVSALLGEVKDVEGFRLQEVTMSAEISAKGELNIIGSTIGLGAKGAITFTFKR